MPTPLELRLHQLSIDFARRVAGIIRGLTIEDLAALCGEDGVPAAKAPTKKARPAPKAGPKAKARWKSARPASPVKTRGPASTPSIPSSSIRRSLGEGGQTSTEPPPSFRVVQPPEDRATAFRRAEQERLESAVLKFVEQNPETDAEIVSQHVGLPKGKAQGLLDDLVLRGKLRMKSGQHGRCYLVVDREGPWVT